MVFTYCIFTYHNPITQTMSIVILDEPYAMLSYEPEIKTGKIIWKGKLTSEQYRGTIMKLINYSKETGGSVEGYLSDIRNQSVISPEDRKWFEMEAVPAGRDLGLKRGGVIFDGNIFKKYYLNLILKTTNKFGIDLKFFSTVEDAEAWFKSFY